MKLFIILKKTFDKQGQTFGNILNILNYYLAYGGPIICNTPGAIDYLIQIGYEALFS